MNYKLTLLIAAFTMLVVSSCGLEENLSKAKDLNGGKEVAYAPENGKKKTVLVYYANESYYATRGGRGAYNRIISALEGGSSSESISSDERGYFNKLIRGLRNDTRDFGNIVEEEIEVLLSNICSPDVQQDLAVVVFSNLMTSSRREFQHCESGSYKQYTEDWDVYEKDYEGVNKFPYEDHPLSHLSVFKDALSQVKKLYSAEESKYILVTKSHGTTEMAMLPKLLINLSEGQGQEFREELREYRRNSTKTTVHIEGSTSIFKVFSSAVKLVYLLGKDILNGGVLVKDLLSKDLLMKDLLSKDLLMKDLLDKDVLDKDVLDKYILSKDLLMKDLLDKDVLAKDVLGKDVLAKDILDKDLLVKDVLAKDILDKDVLVKDVLSKDLLAKDVLDKDLLDKDLLEKDLLNKDLLAKDLLAKDLLAKGNLGDIIFDHHKFGVKKSDYIKTLADSGMQFSLVFMESCKSAFELSNDPDIVDQLSQANGSYKGLRMPNVGYIFTSDKDGIDYRTLDYQKDVFDKLNGVDDEVYASASFFELMFKALNEKSVK